jgi:uracil phosphoribosyltransferase
MKEQEEGKKGNVYDYAKLPEQCTTNRTIIVAESVAVSNAQMSKLTCCLAAGQKHSSLPLVSLISRSRRLIRRKDCH